MAIPIAARAEPEAVLVGSLVGAIVSLVLMLVFEHSLFGVSVGTAGLGFSMASIFPATLSFANRRLRVTGRITGWFVVGSSLGATSIPLVIGKLFTVIGPRSVFLLPAFALLLGGVVLAVLKWVGRDRNPGALQKAPDAEPESKCFREDYVQPQRGDISSSTVHHTPSIDDLFICSGRTAHAKHQKMRKRCGNA
jgi:MFS family permease